MKRAIFQNKHRNIAGVVIASVFALAACGGGGGGDDRGGGGGGLASGTFTRIFNATPTNFAELFGDGAFGDMTAQSLHTAAEIGGSGRITKLRLNNVAGTGSATTCSNTTFRLGHSSLAALTTTFATNLNVGTPVIVFNNATLTIPAGAAGTWFEIALSTPFEYNGFDNLVVQLDRTTACSALVSATNRSGVIDRTAVSFTLDTTPGTADNNTTTAGGLFAYTSWTQFVFEGGDNKIELGGAASNGTPFSTTANRVQMMYLASDINGSGPITGIALQSPFGTVAGTYTYSLRLGHSTLGALTTTFANNYSDSPTTVANAVTYTIPVGVPAGGWVWVPIPSGAFSYNGTDNLLIDFSTTAGSAGNSIRMSATPTTRRLFVADPVGTVATLTETFVGNIALRFNGGPVTVMSTGIDNSETFPFATGAGSSKRQYLYRAAELGTGGSITSVACRLDSVGPTLATSYANFEVVLGHTTSDTLGTTFATNLTGATTAFSGMYALAAGLQMGDWIEIPLSTPFTYDPAQNLVVQLSGDGAANNYSCDTKGDATRYLNRRVANGDRTAAAGSVGSFQSPLRLVINK